MIKLYLLGKKGLRALSDLDKTMHVFITEVIIGGDKNIVEDYLYYIENYCKKNQIKYIIQNKASITPAKFSIAIGWRWLIKDKSNLIIFHDSILPKYRGFNPLVTALINGDNQIGVTVLEGVEEYDTGRIILQQKVNVTYPIKIKEAIDIISGIYSDLLQKLISMLIEGEINYKAQDHEKASYSLWRDEKDYRIDWSIDSNTIKRFVDAVGYPYNGAVCFLDDQQLIIKDTEIIPDINIANRFPGKVIFKDSTGYTIVCGKGLLKVCSFYDLEGNVVKLKSFRLRFS